MRFFISETINFLDVDMQNHDYLHLMDQFILINPHYSQYYHYLDSENFVPLQSDDDNCNVYRSMDFTMKSFQVFQFHADYKKTSNSDSINPFKSFPVEIYDKFSPLNMVSHKGSVLEFDAN
jgi:CRISPR/Cas system CSM-associated protein Csm5 (group 7 of RAMP superfamily)